jgi:rRNA-processing protein FCF1
MMECLYAKCIPYITDCVVGELEKLGQKYKVALKIIKDSRFERIPCMHKGTYADDCLVNRVTQVRLIYIFFLIMIKFRYFIFSKHLSKSKVIIADLHNFSAIH